MNCIKQLWFHRRIPTPKGEVLNVPFIPNNWKLPWGGEDDVEFNGDTLAMNFTGKNIRVEANYPMWRIKYFEIECTITHWASDPGLWFAFWLYGQSGMPEHDFEWCSGQKVINVTYHWGFSYDENKKRATTHNRRGNNHSTNKMKFVVHPNYSRWYLNGKMVREVPRANADDQVVLFDLKLGGYCDYNKENPPVGTMVVSDLKIKKYR